jgi:hypothetical protein
MIKLMDLIKEELSYFFKLEFTPIGKMLYDRLMNDQEIPADYHLYSKDEQVITDMGFYIDEDYGVENKFNSLETFAIENANVEYKKEYKNGKREVLRKINKAIERGWVKVVPY